MPELQGNEASSSSENLTSSSMGMVNARAFFNSLGVTTLDSGLVSNNLPADQIGVLKDWNKQTGGEKGVIMPTLDLFYKKVLLAVSLWPQVEPGRINYLLGKGAGAEIAIRGEIPGRVKHPHTISYRSHSDFELYAVEYNAGPYGENLDLSQVYSQSFLEVFGGQEYFPPTTMKGIRDLPKDLLIKTAEKVNLGGVEILIPQLELLVLDKLLAKEAYPRAEGLDALMVALLYNLDRPRLFSYYDQFVVTPEKGSVEDEIAEGVATYLGRFARQQWELEQSVMKREGCSRADARNRINQGIQLALDNPEAAERIKQAHQVKVEQAWREVSQQHNFVPIHRLQSQATTDYLIVRGAEDVSFARDLWLPASIDDLQEDGSINLEYQEKIGRKFDELNRANIVNRRLRPMLGFFDQVDRLRDKDQSPDSLNF